MSLKDDIKRLARSEGAQLIAVGGVEEYRGYLAEAESRVADTGAQMKDFMISSVPGMPDSQNASFFASLSNPLNTLPAARSVVILGVYAYDESAVYKSTRRELRGKTARTYGYYPVARQIAERVTDFIQQRGYRTVQGQHIPLKFAADRIGLGAYGKNGILRTTKYGSYIALRDVLTEAELEPDSFDEAPSACDGCEKCIRACPTGALYAPYKVNPKLCINPITRRDEYIEPRIRSNMRNWIHGCDICQEVCPANRNLSPRAVDSRAGFDPAHHGSHRNLDGMSRTPELIPLLAPDRPELIRRNAAIALGNVGKGSSKASAALKGHLDGLPESLREYFVWAIEKVESEAP